MAKTLLESLQEKMQPKKPEQAVPGQTQAVQRLQRAGSGKAVAASGPAISSLGEKLSTSQAGQQIRGTQMQGQLQKEQQLQQGAEQAQAGEQKMAQIEQAREQTKAQAAQKMNELLGDFERGKAKLDNLSDIADLEQAGFIARLNNQDYLARLQREGQIKRLGNQNNFDLEMQKTIFDNVKSDLVEDLSFQRMLDADEDEFQRRMAKIGLDVARGDAAAQADMQNIQNIFSGVTGVTSTALEYLEGQEEEEEEEDERGGD